MRILIIKGSALTARQLETDMITLYRNPETGSVDTYEGWDYETDDGEQRNAVDSGEVVELTDEDIDDELQDWKGERTIISLTNGTDVELCGVSVATHPASKRLYRIWWADGSAQTLFRTDEADKMADRFGFDARLVNPGCDIRIEDQDGDQTGGVVFEGWL